MQFSKKLSLLTSALTLTLVSSLATAQDFAEQQVAGFYHQPLGKFQVTALYDGYTSLPSTVFQGIDQAKVQRILDEHFVDHATGVQTSVNAFLVNTGDKLVLIDSGAAKCFGDTLGSIEQNLNAAGYKVEQVDAVLLTHLHPDHACGISAVEGQKSFPKATIYVNQQEAGFWLNPESLKKLPEARQAQFKGTFETVKRIVKPYQDSQQFKTYKIGDEIVKGITVVSTYGHTVGHTSYLIQSGADKLLVLGDVVHNHNLQFDQPDISFAYDYDAAQAVQTRKTQFDAAAKQGYLVAAAHLPFPGIGHVQQVKTGQYAWLPVQYSPNVVPK